MKCEKCNEREASVYITKIVNGEKTEMHLCQECAKEMNAFDDMSLFTPAGFLSSFFEPFTLNTGSGYAIKEKVCPKCGTTFSDFKTKGYFGCSECYNEFKDALSPIIQRMHGKTRHVGKIPAGYDKSLQQAREYEKLTEQLKQAIEAEAYEEAAKIRDKIKKLSE